MPPSKPGPEPSEETDPLAEKTAGADRKKREEIAAEPEQTSDETTPQEETGDELPIPVMDHPPEHEDHSLPHGEEISFTPAEGSETPAYSQYDDVLFYNPRRTYKYWSGPDTKHNTLKEAIAALASRFDSSPEWVEQNLGDTNSLGQIYRNLSKNPVTGSTEVAQPVQAKGFQFYDPRRQYKYWVSDRSKHHTLKEAVNAFARQYDRPPAWIKAHLGETNDLVEIHQNLADAKAAESAKD